jgi:catechol 2,3-dioxygenase-like lactoylglutathione lyase family enzyme
MIGELDHVYYWVRDMDAAVVFYRDVLGLPLVRRDGDEWAEFDAGPVRLALHGAEASGHGGGTAVFRVADLDVARIALRDSGASIEDHVGEVEGFARFATVRDPDGNPVQLIEYAR